jgi:hypothetical protein
VDEDASGSDSYPMVICGTSGVKSSFYAMTVFLVTLAIMKYMYKKLRKFIVLKLRNGTF